MDFTPAQLCSTPSHAILKRYLLEPTLNPQYCTGAILQLTRCGAMDAAKHNVRVNAVCPGPILTPSTQKHAEFEGTTLEVATAKMAAQTILNRCAVCVHRPKLDYALFSIGSSASYLSR